MSSSVQVMSQHNDTNVHHDWTVRDILHTIGMMPTMSPPTTNNHTSSNVGNNEHHLPKLEYLFEEDEETEGVGLLQQPSLTSRVCYNTGVTYLSGLGMGGVWGLMEGLTAKPITSSSSSSSLTVSPRIRINMILNAMTRQGPFLANHLGALAVMYSFIHGGMLKVTHRHQDLWSTVSSAAIAGALLRSTAGIRPMMVAASVLSITLGSMELFRNRDMYLYHMKQSINGGKQEQRE